MSIFKDQYQFMKAAGNEFPECNTEAYQILCDHLIDEEYDEYVEESYYYGPENADTIKEALDLIYVTAQYLNTVIGPEMAEKCWQALHENNMSKCTDGKLVKREDGKVLKPDGYVPLDLQAILK